MINQLKIPENKFIGYCANCGMKIFQSQFARLVTETNRNDVEQYSIFRCIGCKQEIKEDNLIPF